MVKVAAPDKGKLSEVCAYWLFLVSQHSCLISQVAASASPWGQLHCTPSHCHKNSNFTRGPREAGNKAECNHRGFTSLMCVGGPLGKKLSQWMWPVTPKSSAAAGSRTRDSGRSVNCHRRAIRNPRSPDSDHQQFPPKQKRFSAPNLGV